MAEPILDFIGLPQTYGGFGPDFVWRGLRQVLAAEASEKNGTDPVKKPEACNPCSNC